IVSAERLEPFDTAIRAIHFPESPQQLATAEERLKFDELFALELGVAFRKHRVEAAEQGVSHVPDGSLVDRLRETLPFEPPNAQADARVTYALLTAAVTGKDRSRVIEAIAAADVDLVVGTHALVQEGVTFADLSLAVIDEQHRFGVHQRMALKGKGGSPD